MEFCNNYEIRRFKREVALHFRVNVVTTVLAGDHRLYVFPFSFLDSRGAEIEIFDRIYEEVGPDIALHCQNTDCTVIDLVITPC